MYLTPIFTVLFSVGAWFSMEGFSILKIGPLKSEKKNLISKRITIVLDIGIVEGKVYRGKNKLKERSN